MRQAKTTKLVAGKAGKVTKIATATEQLTLDFEGRAPGKTPKAAATVGATAAYRRQPRRAVLDIPEKPKN